jgi:N-acetylneuraminic acid mutarotase
MVAVSLALALAFLASRVAVAQARKAAEINRTLKDFSTVRLAGAPYDTTARAQSWPLISRAAPSTCAAWQERNPFPAPSAYGVAATSDGTYAYAAGGYSHDIDMTLNVFRRFDPVSNAWTVLAPMPDAVFTASAVYSPINNKVYVFGGETPLNESSRANRIYDIASDTWSLGTFMPEGRVQMASGYYNGKIYLIGGYGFPSAQVWEYDPVTDTFNTTRVPMPRAVGGPGFGIINGHFYVAGGLDNTNTVLDLVYDYDIAANTWTTRTHLPTPNRVPGSGVVTGQLWLFGGNNLNTATNASTFYDPASDTWFAGPLLNVARSFIGGTAIGTALLAAGGALTDDHTDFATTETSSCHAVPVAQSAFSRKIHGGVGPFDISLLNNVEVECRRGGATNDYQMIINFANPVTVDSASVTSGTGSVSSFSVSGSQVTVNLTGVISAQRIILTLFNVNDGTHSGDVPIPMRVLVGDVNGNAVVNSSDVSLTKAQVGQPVTGSDFREDVNADGVINSVDVALVKAKVGTGLP